MNVDDAEFVKLFQWLPTTPKWSTIRVNRNAVLDTTEAVREIQSYLDQVGEQFSFSFLVYLFRLLRFKILFFFLKC